MSSARLVWSSLQPVLVGTAYEDSHNQPPPDNAGGQEAQVLWCAGTQDFVRRHPTATAAVDVDHPDGCTDLVIDVDATGHLVFARMECLALDDGLVGLPAEQALPELAQRIAELLG